MGAPSWTPSEKVRDQPQSRHLALFRMKLRADQIVPPDHRGKRSAVIGDRRAGGRDRPAGNDSCGRNRRACPVRARRAPDAPSGRLAGRSSFQPICGIFSDGSDGAIATTSPAIQPRPCDRLEFAAIRRPSAACRRRCRETAVPRPMTASTQRLFQPRHRGEAAAAIGEGADPGQHDPLGGGDILRPAGHDDRRRRSRSRRRRARTPSPPSADCPSRNR